VVLAGRPTGRLLAVVARRTPLAEHPAASRGEHGGLRLEPAPQTGQAVYLEATADRVPDAELADACAEAFRDVDDDVSYTAETLRDEPFVLYRARVTASEVHVRGRDFGDGTGSDQRVLVQL
jgi:hypothetical protein